MAKLSDFVSQKARPLPVIVLADVSGSMTVDGKINLLNQAVKEMLDTFREIEEIRSEIFFSMITFGAGMATMHTPFAPAQEVQWTDMAASGNTPMGAAFTLLQGLLKDKETIPGRSYRPTLVLISDGQPNDDWQGPLKNLLASERAGKAFRFAMGIGEDADLVMLRQFINNSEQRVFSASDARDIRKFFRYVTMSVTSRSKSMDPNGSIDIPDFEDELDDIEF
jgi:uncharacterized protein YegL